MIETYDEPPLKGMVSMIYEDEIERLNKEVATWKGIHEGAVLAMQAEITRLKEKCDKQAMILRRLTPENYPNTLFISGILGALDQNNMPKKICVVPAYGVDFCYIYEYNGTNIVQEW